MQNLIKKVKKFVDRLTEDHIGEYAAQCAYFIILSFIPILILILTLTKYVGLDENALFYTLNQILSENILNEVVISIIKEAYSKSIGTITISAIFTLWSAGKGFLAICKGLESVFKTSNEKKFMYFRIRATVLTIVFIILIILVLLLMVFGNTINTLLINKFNIYSKLFNFIIRFKTIMITAILFVIFLLMYRFIPKHKIEIKSLVPGAIISAAGCSIISYFFSIYVDIFKGFSLMYGSLTTIVLVMMWVYACMYVILLGAEINKPANINDKT